MDKASNKDLQQAFRQPGPALVESVLLDYQLLETAQDGEVRDILHHA